MNELDIERSSLTQFLTCRAQGVFPSSAVNSFVLFVRNEAVLSPWLWCRSRCHFSNTLVSRCTVGSFVSLSESHPFVVDAEATDADIV